VLAAPFHAVAGGSAIASIAPRTSAKASGGSTPGMVKAWTLIVGTRSRRAMAVSRARTSNPVDDLLEGRVAAYRWGEDDLVEKVKVTVRKSVAPTTTAARQPMKSASTPITTPTDWARLTRNSEFASATARCCS
jgi:hypothetical protein